jgi:hypothetical protein
MHYVLSLFILLPLYMFQLLHYKLPKDGLVKAETYVGVKE